MEYTNNALDLDAQTDLLLQKGLIANRKTLVGCLGSVSYHRLAGYWHSFRSLCDDGDWIFHPNTSLNVVWDRYVFDRQLRLLVFDAIERVEVAIRADLINNLAVEQGVFGYLNPENLPNIEAMDNRGNTVYTHETFLSHARALCRRELKNGNALVKKFYDAHSDAHGDYLPFWMLMEIVEFGTLCHLFWGSPKTCKRNIAKKYGLRTSGVMDSWMGTLRSTRNNCAHHGRFWNQRYPVKPSLPDKKNKMWHDPVELEDSKDLAFGTLTILKYLLGYIAPQSGWTDRLEDLFAKHPNIDRRLLGYPDNWRECPIWADMLS
jgi:abortive infection bacteriophage resistance protein